MVLCSLNKLASGASVRTSILSNLEQQNFFKLSDSYVYLNKRIIYLKNENKDSILITTAKYDIMVLSLEYNADGFCDVITKIHGNFKDSVPRNSSLNVITIVESSKSSSVIAIKCYDGILKIIPVTNGDNKALNISTIR